ncbi:MAG TPA: ribose 5-phosphate isomerase A [Actinomycetota bacterium]
MAGTSDVEREKRAAARRSAQLVDDGMRVGLGTGSTVALMLPALGERGLDLRCVATSPETERRARQVGLQVESFDGPESLGRLDIAIDGADQIDAAGWVIKGGGAAHTREKRVAASADRFVLIVDSGKLVERVHGPVPLELLSFGLAATLLDLGSARLRDVPRSPDDGVIADLEGPVEDPAALAARLDATPGVVAHGLFPPSMVSEVVIGRGDDVEIRPGAASE